MEYSFDSFPAAGDFDEPLDLELGPACLGCGFIWFFARVFGRVDSTKEKLMV